MASQEDKRLGKEMAVLAVAGAAVATIVPFVAWPAGAIAGAGYAWYRSNKRKGGF